MTPIVITPPSTEPITLAEAKAHLRVVVADDDAYITSLVAAAREMVEQRTGRALMPQRVRIGLDAFGAITKLPRAPLAATPALVVKYYDEDGAQQTVGDQVYIVNEYVEPVQVTLAYGQQWPTAQARAASVTMEYDVGYADEAAVPVPLKQWMLLAIGTMYENREQNAAGAEIFSIPESFMGLLWQPYMVYL